MKLIEHIILVLSQEDHNKFVGLFIAIKNDSIVFAILMKVMKFTNTV